MKRLYAILCILVILIFNINVYASSDSIDSIDIKVVIMEDGSINVTEVWKATARSGTEFFIPKEHMRDISIENFTVSDEDGPYETIDNWDVDASFEEKSRKAGLHYTSDGVELCFGKSAYKDNTYTLNYTMTNAVQNYEDMDGFNIRFVNDKMDPAPKKVSFEMSLNNGTITEENARVWGFGSTHPIVFKDGKVVVDSMDDFTSRNHLTVLFGLNKGVISPTSVGSGTFERLKNRALEHSDYLDRDEKESQTDEDDDYFWQDYAPDESLGFFGNVKRYLGMFPSLIKFLIIPFVFGLVSKMFKRTKEIKKYHLPSNVDYYRDLPMDADILLNNYIYSSSHVFSIRRLISAYFLKWIKNGNLELRKEEFKKGFIFKKYVEEDCFIIIKEPETIDIMEEKLFNIINKAAGDDGILRNKELTKAFDRGDVVIDYVNEYKKESSIKAQSNNLAEEHKVFLFVKEDRLTMKGRQEAVKQKGFIKFLEDFTLINEREVIEVALWDEYLILAALFGRAKKVLEKFKSINPNYAYADYDGVDPIVMYTVINSLSSNIDNVYHKHVTANSSSSGGGGSMSFGGGGGFSGGGSGGGGR